MLFTRKDIDLAGEVNYTKRMDYSDYVEISTLSPSGLVWKGRCLESFKSVRSYNHFRKTRMGRAVGCKSKDQNGYLSWKMEINGQALLPSRVIWQMLHGEIPNGMLVEHKDGDALNNSPSNLRLATRGQNKMNEKIRKDNESGFKGVSKRGTKWMARIGPGGKTLLGYFSSPEEAHSAYMEAAKNRDPNFYRSK